MPQTPINVKGFNENGVFSALQGANLGVISQENESYDPQKNKQAWRSIALLPSAANAGNPNGEKRILDIPSPF